MGYSHRVVACKTLDRVVPLEQLGSRRYLKNLLYLKRAISHAETSLTKPISYKVNFEFQLPLGTPSKEPFSRLIYSHTGHFGEIIPYCELQVPDLYSLSQNKLPENHSLYSSIYPWRLIWEKPAGARSLYVQSWR